MKGSLVTLLADVTMLLREMHQQINRQNAVLGRRFSREILAAAKDGLLFCDESEMLNIVLGRLAADLSVLSGAQVEIREMTEDENNR